ncbi:hypothetical protein B0A48_10550 [Cryoendolithus antarcticus]|uniref:Uncharacterized protein n=1 Tax=Cryoendolithus antarcticus TaxID=1507870 RepID=A0A1V8SY60_9PEZI|nr:hypothetical protein B0A48_10550 [Cryoendolithus antarcticus]
MAVDIGIDCLKFSHATGMTPEGAIAWTHFTAPGLHLAVRSGTAGDDLVLRLILGNDVMESIEIGALVDRAMQARHGSQQAGVTAQIEQLPIFGIAKDALLALRYRLADGQARRLQFRLPGAEQCSQLVKVFRDRGMEFQEQRPRTARPETTRPGTASSGVRPATGQSVTSTYFPSAQSHNTLSAAPASLSQASVTQLSNKAVPHDAHNHSIFRPPPLPASLDSAASTKHTVPPSSSHPPRSEVNYTHAPAASLHIPPASRSLGLLASPVSELTAPTNILDLPDTLEHELPPRRELPFKRPGSQQTNSLRPGTAAPPTRVNLGAAARPSTANPLKRLHEQEDVYARPATSMMPNALPVSAAPAMANRDTTNQRTVAQQHRTRRPSNIGELVRNRLPLAESNGNKIMRVSSLVDAPHEIDTPPASSPSKAEYDPSARLMATVQAPGDRTLHEYAAQSSEDRKAAMDEFIVSRLEDRDFATLCENVDQCWRRIALGL